MVGGIGSVLQGGKFGHGFASAGLTKFISVNAAFDKAGMGSVKFDNARIAAAAILGGTISDATGGKFANGAMTAAMGQALNGNQQNAREQAIKKLKNEYQRALEKIEAIRDDFSELASDASIRLGIGAAEVRLGFSDGRPAFDMRAAFNKWSFHASGWSIDLDTNWFSNEIAGNEGRLWLGGFAQAKGALGPFRASFGGEGAIFLSNGTVSGYTNDNLFTYDTGLRFSKSYSAGVGWRIGGVSSQTLF